MQTSKPQKGALTETLAIVRSAIFAVIYTLLTVIYGAVAIVLKPLHPRIRHRIIVSWTHLVITLLSFICGVRYQLLGKDHLPSQNTPVVILAKHQSTWETLYLQGLFWPASTVLKRELLKIPFFGWGLQALLPIAIDRTNPRVALRDVKSKGVQQLSRSYNVLLFPEGTRVAPGEKGKYARSGADIAIEAGVDIIPIAVNSGHCWPAKSFAKYPGLVSVVVGKPISSKGKTSKVLIDEVEGWIESTMASL